MRIKAHELPSGQTLYYTGPDFAWGAVPTVFYFSISGKNSLSLDPFNQPAAFLAKLPIRVCSFDLPHHRESDDPLEAIGKWAEDFLLGKNPIEDFLTQTLESLNFMQNEGLFDERLAFSGLSRGAFFATHLAARFSKASFILGFAPMTRLFNTKEFAVYPNLEKEASEFDLIHLKDKLLGKSLRYYISNYDTRVGTRSCYEFIEALSSHAAETRAKNTSIELTITSPIGHQGHGTSPEIFKEGAIWLAKKLGIKDEALDI